jgi:hypothetical protein
MPADLAALGSTTRRCPLTFTLTQARKLLTAAELEVFATSRGEALKALTVAQLARKVQRTRTLRDKFQDLLRRQVVATRTRTGSKTGTDDTANARTAQKAQLFDEVLQRFEARRAQLEAAAERAARKTAAAKKRRPLVLQRQAQADAAVARTPARSRKAPMAKPGTAGAGQASGSGSERALVARHAMQPRAAGVMRVQAHVSSQGRRAQGRRDGRG